MAELELLCFIADVTFDEEGPEGSVKELLALLLVPAKPDTMSKVLFSINLGLKYYIDSFAAHIVFVCMSI